MKPALAIIAIFVLASPALAGANFELKEQGTKSQGNCVGVFSSQGTGNGAVVGGNGTLNGQPLPESGDGSDQTTAPGSRAEQVRAAREADC
jgi:hypothetical protein